MTSIRSEEYAIIADPAPLGGKILTEEVFTLSLDEIRAQFTRVFIEGQTIRRNYVRQLARESELEEKRLRDEESVNRSKKASS